MLRNKKVSIKKGYILISVLIIGTICMTFALYCFKLQLQERGEKLNCNNSYMKLNQECREYLLTRLSKYIENEYLSNNLTAMDEEEIQSYFFKSDISKFIRYKDTYVEFEKDNMGNNDKYYFTLILHYGSGDHMKEKYDYIIQDGKIKFIYIKTVYEGGKIS